MYIFIQIDLKGLIPKVVAVVSIESLQKLAARRSKSRKRIRTGKGGTRKNLSFIDLFMLKSSKMTNCQSSFVNRIT